MRLVMGVLLSAMLCVSCGTQRRLETEAVGTRLRGSLPASVSSVPEPGSSPEPMVPNVDRGELQQLLSSNPNRADSALGSLCWLSWETARHLLLETVEGTTAVPSLSGSAVDAILSSAARARVDEALHEGEFPDGVARFAVALIEALERAQSVGQTRSATEFDFESFPGAREYMDAAVANADCVQP